MDFDETFDQPFYKIQKLDEGIFLFISEQNDHKMVKIKSNQLEGVRQILNLGSITSIKQEGKNTLVLNKGENQSRLFEIQSELKIDLTKSFELDSKIDKIWKISEAKALV